MSDTEPSKSASHTQSAIRKLVTQHASASIAVAICAVIWLTQSHEKLEKAQDTLSTMLLFAVFSMVCSVLSVHVEALARRATHSTIAVVLLLAGCNILKHLLMICVLLFALTLLKSG